MMNPRVMLSQNYLKGKGIEIGAHHAPFPIHDGMQVTYIEKHTPKELDQYFPEIDHSTSPKQTIIDDGHELKSIEDQSQDFVIASHVLEHFFSPITAIQNHLRVLKEGGRIVYAIPLKNNPIDKDRKISSYACLREDQSLFEDRKEFKTLYLNALKRHYHEYLEFVDKILDSTEREKIAEDRIKKDLDIHFHCWDINSLYYFFNQMIYLKSVPNFEVELFFKNDIEVFVILRKL